jgi:hypothetical protein
LQYHAIRGNVVCCGVEDVDGHVGGGQCSVMQRCTEQQSQVQLSAAQPSAVSVA